MTDPRLEKLARVLVQYSIPVRKYDLVHLTGNLESSPLVELLYEEVLRAGGHPWVRLVPASCTEALVRLGSDEQIQYCGPLDKAPGKTVFSYAHPIFWAPFTIVGDGGRPVVAKN